MMNTIINTIKTSAVVLITLILVSCESFVEVDHPKAQLISTEVFANDATAIAAVSNIYYGRASGSSLAGGGSGSFSLQCGLSADELDTYSTAEIYRQVQRNGILSDNSFTTNMWSEGYSIIYQANALLEGIAKSEAISEPLRKQLNGECLFWRAFAHFHLSNVFGDIPYIGSTDYRSNALAKRMPATEILNRVTADLIAAKALLITDYGMFKQERVRVNKWAATALLARVYLYQQNWAAAEAEASSVMNETALFKLTGLNEVFLKNSLEAIWQIKPVSTTLNTNDGATFILTARPTSVALRNDFKSNFESEDLRKQQWVGNLTLSTGSWDFPYKYKIKLGGTPLNEYSMVLRLAEQYLIRAEARAQQNKLSLAIDDLDAIRSRAGLKKLSLTNPGIIKEDLLKAIQQERRVELFCEWGHRWFDLKRTGKATEVLSAIKTGFKPSALLFPIPASEIRLNPNMTQNPDYN